MDKAIRFEEVWGVLELKKFPETITHKIFESTSGFHVKPHNGKSLSSEFQEFSASINKTFILAVTLGTMLLFSDV